MGTATEADPGLLDKGFKFTKGCSICYFFHIFLKILHKKWNNFTSLTGVRANPLKLLWILHWANYLLISRKNYFGWSTERLHSTNFVVEFRHFYITFVWRWWGSNLQPLCLESSTLPLSHCAPDLCLCWCFTSKSTIFQSCLPLSGQFPVFLCWTSTKQRIKCLAQGHNTVPLELGTLLSPV